MHVLANDIYCLSPVEDYISTDHYYDVNDIPSHEVVVATVSQLIAKWEANPNPELEPRS
jgi:hypothetical protein